MNGRKYLCHVKEDAELQAIVRDLESEIDDKKQQVEFLLKRAEQLRKAASEIHKRHWTQIELRLRALGKLPSGYSDDDHTLVFDENDGIFYWDRRNTHSLAAFLSELSRQP